MSSGYLQRLLIDTHGAGHAGVHFRPLLGTLSIYSEQDPYTLKTFENFERVYQHIAEGKFEYSILTLVKRLSTRPRSLLCHGPTELAHCGTKGLIPSSSMLRMQ